MGCNATRATPRYEPRACAICGTTFVPARKNQVVCSDLCRYERHQEQIHSANAKRREYDRTPRACAICGTIFSPERNNQACCSDTCRGAWLLEHPGPCVTDTDIRNRIGELERKKQKIEAQIELLKKELSDG